MTMPRHDHSHGNCPCCAAHATPASGAAPASSTGLTGSSVSSPSQTGTLTDDDVGSGDPDDPDRPQKSLPSAASCCSGHTAHTKDACCSSSSHHHPHAETTGKSDACSEEHSGCACCSNPLEQRASDGTGLDNEQRKELTLLGGSAAIFFAALILRHGLPQYAGRWVDLVFLLIYVVCGFSVFRSAFSSIKERDIFNEFSLMCGASLAAIFLGHLEEAVGVMLFYRIGEFLQELASSKSRSSIRSLLAAKPTSANLLLDDGSVESRSVEDVPAGSLIVIRPGEKIPLDGIVVSGASSVDQSPLTGESAPQDKMEGDSVMGGSLNMDGVLSVRTSGDFKDTHMARILEMVENAAARKSPTERFITRFAHYYTPAVVAAAALIAVLPPLLGGAEWSTWIYRALVLLVISCPCALIISIPLSYFGGIGAASRHGILVKGGNVLDGMHHTRTVVFDKTGTLSQGRFQVSDIVPAQGVTKDQLLQAAALAESDSNHPVARSIMRIMPEFKRPADLEVTEIPGHGMRAVSGGVTRLAGKEALLLQNGLKAPEVLATGTVVYVAEGGTYLGHILVQDTIKPDSRAALDALRTRGLRTAILSGDRESVVAWVAGQVGCDTYKAELLPGDKVKAMEELDNKDAITFVGDGINDAPSLVLARVGIAMGGVGSEAAIEAADAVIINDSPLKVAVLYNIADKVRSVVWQNIALSLGVKGLFMVLGVVGLSGLWEAVFADVGVALLAVLNSLRASRGVDEKGESRPKNSSETRPLAA